MARFLHELSLLITLAACGSINVVLVLRCIAPERWPQVWKLLVLVVVLWCGIAIWEAVDLWFIRQQLQLDAGRGLKTMGPIHRVLLWPLLSAPSFVGFGTLLLWRPKGSVTTGRTS